MRREVLIIYTGGTFGMAAAPDNGALVPRPFLELVSNYPALSKLVGDCQQIDLSPIRDSSEMAPKDYMRLRDLMLSHKESLVLVIHGTDTLAYTASAISFLMRGLGKKVVFTGAQIPLGLNESDALSNLKLAKAALLDERIKEEVLIAFGGKILRGNRAEKKSSIQLTAFDSPMFPAIRTTSSPPESTPPLKIKSAIDHISGVSEKVIYLPVYPGLSYKSYVSSIVDVKPKGIVLGTYGSGNIPSSASFQMVLKTTIQKGIPVMAVSQNYAGRVDLSTYESGRTLLSLGVISGKDLTLPAALTKMMVLLGEERGLDELRDLLGRNLAGEMTDE